MVGLFFSVLLGLLAFLCHLLSTLLPSAFLRQPVCSPVQASSSRDQPNLFPHHPFLWLREHVRFSTLPHCAAAIAGSLGGFSCLPLKPTRVQRGQACSYSPTMLGGPHR